MSSVLEEIDERFEDSPWTLVVAIIILVLIIVAVTIIILVICHWCCNCCQQRSEAIRTRPRNTNRKFSNKLSSEKGNCGEPSEKYSLVKPNVCSDQQICIDPKELISKVLVVLICIGKYEGDPNNKTKLKNLKNTQTDFRNMIKVFRDKYGYDMITNQNDVCTLSDYEHIIAEAQHEFNHGDYQCIFLIYSGHGDKDYVFFSDLVSNIHPKNQYEYKKKDRSKMESCFDGNIVPNKAAAYKIFFIDACRGFRDANVIEILHAKGLSGRNNAIHVDGKRMIFYPNTSNYASYDTSKGGVLLASVYNVMISSMNDGKSWSDLYDLIKANADNRVRKVQGNNGKIERRTTLIDMNITMSIKEMRTIRLGKSNRNKEHWLKKNNDNNQRNILYL